MLHYIKHYAMVDGGAEVLRGGEDVLSIAASYSRWFVGVEAVESISSLPYNTQEGSRWTALTARWQVTSCRTFCIAV